jgi:hypothetical protein
MIARRNEDAALLLKAAPDTPSGPKALNLENLHNAEFSSQRVIRLQLKLVSTGLTRLGGHWSC